MASDNMLKLREKPLFINTNDSWLILIALKFWLNFFNRTEGLHGL
jgi:hypothetical protein